MWIHLLILGLIDGASDATVAPAAAPTVSPGVHRARFLRRGPKLPWEEEIPEEIEAKDVSIAPSIRKRIRLPRAVKEALADAVPLETHVVIDAPRIKVPGIGSAVLKIDTAEEEAILMMLQ